VHRLWATMRNEPHMSLPPLIRHFGQHLAELRWTVSWPVMSQTFLADRGIGFRVCGWREQEIAPVTFAFAVYSFGCFACALAASRTGGLLAGVTGPCESDKFLRAVAAVSISSLRTVFATDGKPTPGW
jgi:hypothetical protein